MGAETSFLFLPKAVQLYLYSAMRAPGDLYSATKCLCKVRKDVHPAQVFRCKAYRKAQTARAPGSTAYTRSVGRVAVWRAPSRAVVPGAAVAVRGLCLPAYPID